MMKRIPWMSAALAALAATTFTGLAGASSHREAPAIATDPQADNTDLWAWVDPTTHANLYVVASYNPMEEPSGGPNFHKFGDDVLYEIHLARGDGQLDDAFTYQIKFSTAAIPTGTIGTLGGGLEFFSQLAGAPGGGYAAQTYTVTQIANGVSTVLASNLPVAPPNAGPRTEAVVFGGTPYNDAFAATFIKALAGGGGQVWAGPRDDGFYADLGAIFDLANLRIGPGAGGAATALDGVSGFNCHTIALSIPTSILRDPAGKANGTPDDKETLGVWASASRRKVRILRASGTDDQLGPWKQVSRLGLPLVNEALIGLQDKDKYNRTAPKTDVANFAGYFLNPVLVLDANAVGIYTAYGVPAATVTALETNRTDILNTINLTNIPTANAHAIPIMPGQTGDVIRVDMNIDSGFPNGRPIPGGAASNQEQADVTDVVLSMVLANFTVPPGCPSVALDHIGDCTNHNDKPYLATFPFLAGPWRGYDGGHGKLAN